MSAGKERRSHKRKAHEGGVKFSVVGVLSQRDILPSNAEGLLTDLSETGVGLSTDLPLKPGLLIKFAKKKTDGKLPDVGIVMWTVKSPDGYKAGVKFV